MPVSSLRSVYVYNAPWSPRWCMESVGNLLGCWRWMRHALGPVTLQRVMRLEMLLVQAVMLHLHWHTHVPSLQSNQRARIHSTLSTTQANNSPAGYLHPRQAEGRGHADRHCRGPPCPGSLSARFRTFFFFRFNDSNTWRVQGNTNEKKSPKPFLPTLAGLMYLP